MSVARPHPIELHRLYRLSMVKEIRISDYGYDLPQQRIALHPCEPRDACRLLVNRRDGAIEHLRFRDLPAALPSGSLMVCNNTRVIKARLRFRKSTGAGIEIFCLEPEHPRDYAQMFQSKGSCRWTVLVGNLKRWKDGALTMPLTLADGRAATLSARNVGEASGNGRVVEFSWTPQDATFASVIEAAGVIPIPPYLNRESEDSDTVDYQTVYSKIKGSVAAPTAGLHFTADVLERLAQRGVEVEELTLHVGAGTFQPVKAEEIGDHPMHTEVFSVSRELLESLVSTLRSGRDITAVGTTTVRTLESLPWLGARIAREPDAPLHVSQWQPYEEQTSTTKEAAIAALETLLRRMDSERSDSLTASTAIMIAPGYRWRIVDHIITNFHQPNSTLLLLVASFLERRGGDSGSWRKMYADALAHDYMFLSYGDSSLLL